MKKTTTRKSLYLDTEDLKRLEDIAKDNDVSISRLLREAMKEYLQRHDGSDSLDELLGI